MDGSDFKEVREKIIVAGEDVLFVTVSLERSEVASAETI